MCRCSRAPRASGFCNTAGVDFYSAYEHGFARIAACTGRIDHRRPAGQRRGRAAARRAPARRGRRRGRVPRAVPRGYSIEDLLLQDALLDAVEAALADGGRGAADLLPVLVVGAPLRHRNRVYNCAVVIHAGEVLGVAPKSYLPTYREFYERPQIAPGDDQAGQGSASPARTCRSAPTCSSPPTTCRAWCCTSRSARTCGSRCPPAREAALAGATVLLNLSGSPITSAGPRTGSCSAPLRVRPLPGRVRLRRGRAGRVDHRPVLGRPDDDLRERRPARRDRALPRRRPRRSVADVDLDLLRQERAADGHLRRQPPHPRRRSRGDFRRVDFTLDPPAGDLGLRREVERFPFVPADDERLEQDCYEAYNIQVAGLRAAAGGDRSAEGRHRRLGRPRLHPRADRRRAGRWTGWAAAQRHPRLHAARLRDQRRHQGQRAPADASRSA